MKKYLLVLFLFICYFHVDAQYSFQRGSYFLTQLVQGRQLQKEHDVFKNLNVKKITAEYFYIESDSLKKMNLLIGKDPS